MLRPASAKVTPIYGTSFKPIKSSKFKNQYIASTRKVKVTNSTIRVHGLKSTTNAVLTYLVWENHILGIPLLFKENTGPLTSAWLMKMKTDNFNFFFILYFFQTFSDLPGPSNQFAQIRFKYKSDFWGGRWLDVTPAFTSTNKRLEIQLVHDDTEQTGKQNTEQRRLIL